MDITNALVLKFLFANRNLNLKYLPLNVVEVFIGWKLVALSKEVVEVAICNCTVAFVGSLPSKGAGASSNRLAPLPSSNKSYGSSIWSMVMLFIKDTSNIPVKDKVCASV